MNLFACDPDPVVSARALADLHVVKMTVEVAQIASTVLRAHAPAETCDAVGLYRPTHAAHPCTVWAGSGRAAFDWTVDHGFALAEEYSRRYGRDHKSAMVVFECWNLAHFIPDAPLLPFALAMPDEHLGPDPHAAYRSYLRSKYAAWGNAARWTNAVRPEWS